MTIAERDELLALLQPGEGTFSDAVLTALETTRRIERYEETDDGYYLRLTELGTWALRLWPLIQVD